MRTETRTIRLHRMQAAFRRSNANYRGFVGGRGSGKSWSGAYDMLRRARRGRTYLIGSPTGILMQDTTYPTFKKLAQEMGVWDPARVRMSPYPTVELTTGASVRFRTAEDPERMRGPNLSGVWLDEASLMHVDAYNICIAALREGGEQGWLSATFTPKGLAHWTYDVFGTARADTEIFHASTRDNPFNPSGFQDTLARQYGGGESALSRQELDGLFLDDEDGWQVIPASWVRAAQGRWSEGGHGGHPLTCLGVDVAYGGADATVIMPRRGVWFGRYRKYSGVATDSGSKAAFLVLKEHDGQALIQVDGIGYGAACHEHLRDKVGDLAVAVNVAASPQPEVWDRSRKYKLVNYRSAMYWLLREALDPENGDGLALPPDRELLADLTAPKFELRASGIIVEPKEKLKERLGRSPDVGDAVALAHLRPQKRRFAMFA
jgi:hypothetical protein